MDDPGHAYEGACFCGAVRFTLRGAPEAMGYCHCDSCREWSAAMVNAFTLWKVTALEVTRGGVNIRAFNRTPRSTRKWCAACGGHIFTEHPQWGLVDVYAALIPGLAFKPEVHVHYQETKLAILDGLMKMKDLPTHMGGSGVVLPEFRAFPSRAAATA